MSAGLTKIRHVADVTPAAKMNCHSDHCSHHVMVNGVHIVQLVKIH